MKLFGTCTPLEFVWVTAATFCLFRCTQNMWSSIQDERMVNGSGQHHDSLLRTNVTLFSLREVAAAAMLVPAVIAACTNPPAPDHLRTASQVSLTAVVVLFTLTAEILNRSRRARS